MVNSESHTKRTMDTLPTAEVKEEAERLVANAIEKIGSVPQTFQVKGAKVSVQRIVERYVELHQVRGL